MSTLEILIVLFALFLAFVISYKIGKSLGSTQMNRIWEKKLPDIRADAAKRSRAVLQGQFSEQLAPYLPNFPYSPSECKFLGSPIDLIVFKGLENNAVEEIVFVEVKTGKSRLNKNEQSLKSTILSKNVRWEEFRPD